MSMITINDTFPGYFHLMSKYVHENAVDHGWWEEPREDGTLIALMHSELSEALEALRKGNKPDEPPVDESKRFKPGEKVEIFSSVGEWKEAIYLTHQSCHCANGCQHLVYIPWVRGMGAFEPDRIRPLPDDTADTVKCGICGKPINERTAANDVECGPCCPEHYEDDTAAN